MSRLLLLVLASLAALALAEKTQQRQQYTQKYDNFDSDTLVRNDRILLNYYKCIMDQGPCTKDGKLFKRVLPEALRTNCIFCTSKQTLLVRKMLQAIKTKSEPRFYDLISKFDGDGQYRESILEFIFGTSETEDE